MVQDNEGNNSSTLSSKERVCFYCQQAGHKDSNCLGHKPKLSNKCYVPRKGDVSEDNLYELVAQYCDVTVNGHDIKALIDTGSAMSLIKHCHIPETLASYANTTTIQCESW